jgi:hypothetical protein
METATHRMPPLTQWEEAAGGCAKADDARGVDCHTKSGKRLECSVHKVCRLRSWVQQSGKRKYSRNVGGRLSLLRAVQIGKTVPGDK